jgi:hypothetical protein
MLIMKRFLSSIFILLSIAIFALGQSIPTGGARSDVDKSVERLNTDVAAWNKRCKTTKTATEEAWCKKERARIDAKRAELVAAGAIPR